MGVAQHSLSTRSIDSFLGLRKGLTGDPMKATNSLTRPLAGSILSETRCDSYITIKIGCPTL